MKLLQSAIIAHFAKSCTSSDENVYVIEPYSDLDVVLDSTLNLIKTQDQFGYCFADNEVTRIERLLSEKMAEDPYYWFTMTLETFKNEYIIKYGAVSSDFKDFDNYVVRIFEKLFQNNYNIDLTFDAVQTLKQTILVTDNLYPMILWLKNSIMEQLTDVWDSLTEKTTDLLRHILHWEAVSKDVKQDNLDMFQILLNTLQQEQFPVSQYALVAFVGALEYMYTQNLESYLNEYLNLPEVPSFTEIAFNGKTFNLPLFESDEEEVHLYRQLINLVQLDLLKSREKTKKFTSSTRNKIVKAFTKEIQLSEGRVIPVKIFTDKQLKLIENKLSKFNESINKQLIFPEGQFQEEKVSKSLLNNAEFIRVENISKPVACNVVVQEFCPDQMICDFRNNLCFQKDNVDEKGQQTLTVYQDANTSYQQTIVASAEQALILNYLFQTFTSLQILTYAFLSKPKPQIVQLIRSTSPDKNIEGQQVNVVLQRIQNMYKKVQRAFQDIYSMNVEAVEWEKLCTQLKLNCESARVLLQEKYQIYKQTRQQQEEEKEEEEKVMAQKVDLSSMMDVDQVFDSANESDSDSGYVSDTDESESEEESEDETMDVDNVVLSLTENQLQLSSVIPFSFNQNVLDEIGNSFILSRDGGGNIEMFNDQGQLVKEFSASNGELLATYEHGLFGVEKKDVEGNVVANYDTQGNLLI